MSVWFRSGLIVAGISRSCWRTYSRGAGSVCLDSVSAAVSSWTLLENFVHFHTWGFRILGTPLIMKPVVLVVSQYPWSRSRKVEIMVRLNLLTNPLYFPLCHRDSAAAGFRVTRCDDCVLWCRTSHLHSTLLWLCSCRRDAFLSRH